MKTTVACILLIFHLISASGQTIECSPVFIKFKGDSTVEKPGITCPDDRWGDCDKVELFDVTKWEKDATTYSWDKFPTQEDRGWIKTTRVEINRVSGEAKKVISEINKPIGGWMYTTILYKCKPSNAKPIM